MRNLLGGKGSNLCEMTRLLGADLVPGGFVITTEACVAHMTAGSEPPEPMLRTNAPSAVKTTMRWLHASVM